jgi:hypothetical protein
MGKVSAPICGAVSPDGTVCDRIPDHLGEEHDGPIVVKPDLSLNIWYWPKQ